MPTVHGFQCLEIKNLFRGFDQKLRLCCNKFVSVADCTSNYAIKVSAEPNVDRMLRQKEENIVEASRFRLRLSVLKITVKSPITRKVIL